MPFNRGLVIRTLTIVAIALGVFSPAVGLTATTMPNVIFILADDLGWGDLPRYGNEGGIETPNLNLLADQGVLYAVRRHVGNQRVE